MAGGALCGQRGRDDMQYRYAQVDLRESEWESTEGKTGRGKGIGRVGNEVRVWLLPSVESYYFV